MSSGHEQGLVNAAGPSAHPPRSIQACLDCRKSKLKCDGMLRADSTCTRCRKRGKKCNWSVHLLLPVATDSHQADSNSSGERLDDGHLSHSPPYIASTSPHNSSQSRKRQRDFQDDERSPRPQSRHAVSWSRRRQSHPDSPPSNLDSGALSRELSASPSNSGPSTNPAPLVHLREVALLSPESTHSPASNSFHPYESLTTTTPDVYSNALRPSRDAATAEIQQLLSLHGWTMEKAMEVSVERRKFFERAISSEPDSLRALDPLELGLLNQDDATRLFALYYNSINTQHCLLDPVQDTWLAVHARSMSLFITIIAISASIDDHARSRSRKASLLRNMDDTVTQLLLSNAKSPDVVKTLLLAYLFTQKPAQVADDRCWLLVDAASRTAAELGLGLRLRTPQASVVDTDTYAHRNAERAWIFSVVMQRSLSTSTGLWSIGKLDVKWDKIEEWCECKIALPGDVQLVAYLFLRRLEYHTRTQFEKIDVDKFLTLESVRAGFNALFENWKRRWVQHPKLVNEHFSRSFLLTVGQHIQLLLNVTALKLAEGTRRRRRDFSRDMPSDLQSYCANLATDLCTQFITNFQGRGHELCRNIVSMVTWSTMALLQMEPETGRLLALRVALVLAGDGNDQDHRTNLSYFYGRCLLSLVNDLALNGPPRNKSSRGKNSSKTREPHWTSSNGASTAVTTSTPSTSPAQHTTPSEGRVDWHADGSATNQISAEKMLSSMAAPLTADPFNEAWLNSFLDNLVPVSWPSSSDERQAMAFGGSQTQTASQAGQPSGVPSQPYIHVPTPVGGAAVMHAAQNLY